MSGRFTAVLCPHGRATSWTGISVAGDTLPEVERCEDCNPGSVALPSVAQLIATHERVWKFAGEEFHHGGEFGEGWRACIDHLRGIRPSSDAVVPLSDAGLVWLRQYFIDTYNTDWASTYQLELVGDVPDEVLGWADTDRVVQP